MITIDREPVPVNEAEINAPSARYSAGKIDLGFNEARRKEIDRQLRDLKIRRDNLNADIVHMTRNLPKDEENKRFIDEMRQKLLRLNDQIFALQIDAINLNPPVFLTNSPVRDEDPRMLNGVTPVSDKDIADLASFGSKNPTTAMRLGGFLGRVFRGVAGITTAVSGATDYSVPVAQMWNVPAQLEQQVGGSEVIQKGDVVEVTADVNLRNGSSTISGLNHVLIAGQKMEVQNIVTMSDGNWYYVMLRGGEFDGDSGYVRADKVKREQVQLTPFAPAPAENAGNPPKASGDGTAPASVEGKHVQPGATMTPGPVHFYGMYYEKFTRNRIEMINKIVDAIPLLDLSSLGQNSPLIYRDKPVSWGYNPEFVGNIIGDHKYAQYTGIFRGSYVVNDDVNPEAAFHFYVIDIPTNDGTNFVRLVAGARFTGKTVSVNQTYSYSGNDVDPEKLRRVGIKTNAALIKLFENPNLVGQVVQVGSVIPSGTIDAFTTAVLEGIPLPDHVQPYQLNGMNAFIVPASAVQN